MAETADWPAREQKIYRLRRERRRLREQVRRHSAPTAMNLSAGARQQLRCEIVLQSSSPSQASHSIGALDGLSSSCSALAIALARLALMLRGQAGPLAIAATGEPSERLAHLPDSFIEPHRRRVVEAQERFRPAE